MPLEGHFDRVNTPLRRLTRRERSVLVLGSLATTVTILVLILVTAGDTRPGPAPGCIEPSIAGRTGAELLHRCGAEAVAACRHARELDGPAGEAILAACRQAGVRF